MSLAPPTDKMSDAARYLTFFLLAGTVIVMDWRRRAIWRGLPLLGAALGLLLVPEWSWWGVGIGALAPLIGELPQGDVAVGAMMGGWIGVFGILLVWSFALGAGLIVWIGYREGWWDWPGDWPFTPFLMVPACVIVLTIG